MSDAAQRIADASAQGASAQTHLSPSFAGRRAGAYEIKFLLDDAVADEILAIARRRMGADPNADPALGDRYEIHSLYFDNDHWDVFRRNDGFRRHKFRLRRYGRESRIYLERKSKSKGVVYKLRSPIEESEIDRLLAEPDPNWSGYWFHSRLHRKAFQPACVVRYDRTARVDSVPEGVIRLTVDRQVRCRRAEGPEFPLLEDGAPILVGQSIVEFKFRVTMPTLFRNLVADFQLAPASVSKYRQSLTACGLPFRVTAEENPAGESGGGCGGETRTP